MKRLILYILIVIPLAGTTQSLSIEELWTRAEKDRKYQEQQLQVAITELDTRIALNDRLPVFYGDGNLQRNLIIPVTPVPAIAFDPTAPEGTILPLKFATKWNARAGIQLQWNVFDPARKLNIREKELAIEKSKLQLAKTREDWTRDATLAYASVVLATFQYQQAREDSLAYETILQTVKQRYEAGREPAVEYNAARQELERKKIRVVDAWSVLVRGHLELQKYVSLDSVRFLSSDINTIKSFLQSRRPKHYEADIQQLETQLASLRLNAAKRSLLPSVTLNGYYGGQYYNNSFKLWDGSYWYGNSYLSLGLRLPISDYLWSGPLLKKYNLQAELSHQQYKSIITTDSIQFQQTQAKVDASGKKLAHLFEIESLARDQMQMEEAAYRAGRKLISDYNRAVSNYIKARQDVWQAQYDWIVAFFEK